jgi:hypothetical protein
MANPEHVEILKQGVRAWNLWRVGHKSVHPDLSDADLIGAVLTGAVLTGTNLSHADLSRATFVGADLIGADLSRADLSRADFSNADLSRAVISPAVIDNVDFRETNLSHADLSNSLILSVDFSDTVLVGADLTGVRLGNTTFAGIDLSEVKGLETIDHFGPSSIGVDTIYKSRGKIPEVFLRGCGLPESFIVQIPAHVAALEPIEFYSCFISYSSKDQDFAECLHADLQHKGVRCWFAPEDLKIGDRFRDRINESIRLHDKLLLILSEHSVSSPWVSDEVEAAIEREHREGRTVLFPIKIDEAVMESEQAWAAAIRRTRHIGDFTRWKDHDSYQKAFGRLLRDLKAEEKEV